MYMKKTLSNFTTGTGVFSCLFIYSLFSQAFWHVTNEICLSRYLSIGEHSYGAHIFPKVISTK